MTKMVKITEQENLHLVNMMGVDRQLTIKFGPSGAYVDEYTELWALTELMVMRGLIHPITFSEDYKNE